MVDLEFAHTVLMSAASRSTTRRSSTCGSARACAATASSWRSRRAAERARPERDAVGAHPARRRGRVPGRARRGARRRRRARARARAHESDVDAARVAELLRDGGEDVVILWGERSLARGRARHAAEHRRPARARRRATAPACSRSPPAPTAAACARPARCPTPAPATARSVAGPRRARRSPRRAADGELTALYLFQTDPIRDVPDRALWERALHARGAGRRARLGADRGARGARQRDLPGRVLRREGGHGRPSRRPPAAAADRDRPPRRGPRRLVGARRASPARRARHRRADLADGVRAAGRGGPVLPRDLARGDRAGAACAGPSSTSASELPAPASDQARPATAGEAARARAPAAETARRARTERCGSAPTARSGPRPRSRSRRRCSSPIAEQQVELSPEDARRLGIGNGDADRGLAERDAAATARAHVRSGVPAGTAFLADGIADGSANALTEPLVEVSKRVTLLLADVNYFEPWWVQIIKALRDLRRSIFAVLPILIVYERKLLGRFQAPLRPQPRRPVRPAAAAGRDRQVRDQGAVPADHVGRLPVPDRADDRDPHRGRRAGDHPVGRRPAHLRPAGRPVRDRRLDRPAVRVRARRHLVLRDHARRLGLGLEVLVPRRDARRRAADLLRGLAGPGAGRRGDHRPDAVADRDRPRPGRACGTSSRSSSAS